MIRVIESLFAYLLSSGFSNDKSRGRGREHAPRILLNFGFLKLYFEDILEQTIKNPIFLMYISIVVLPITLACPNCAGSTAFNVLSVLVNPDLRVSNVSLISRIITDFLV
jgi:hypothetical protein